LKRNDHASTRRVGACARVVFNINIKGNDYRLIAGVQYRASVLVIRFFGTSTHAEYDEIDAETVS
jgi:mRNA interferase HigB